MEQIMDQEMLREEMERRAEEIQQDAEFEFIKIFIQYHRDDWNDCGFQSQLRALWTTLCLHFGLEVDTLPYDSLVTKLEQTGIAADDGSGLWTPDVFENFMAEHMV